MTPIVASYSSGLRPDIHRGVIRVGPPRRSHLASPPDRGKKPGLHGAFERPLGSGPDPLDHRHPPRPEPLHPRQHRVRREGAAQHAAGPVPGDWPRLRHGAPRGAGPTARPASGKAWSRHPRSTRCGRSTAGRRGWLRSSARRWWWSTATSPSRTWGSREAEAEKVAKDIDVLINSSGRVTFNPPLESALRTNVEGTKNVIAFAKRMKRPALIHTSTCFVAGNRSGEVWEDEELDGYFPRHHDLPGTRFSVEQEMADNAAGAARIRELADDAQVLAKLRQEARDRLREEKRDFDDEASLKLAVARARKEWIRSEMTRQGVERAANWGWPNIYTYTKSMGDQLVARETGIVRAIVRPAIVESAVEYPFRGWNEGFTTSAPLVYLALKGQNTLPVAPKLILDVVPVDHVVAGMLMVAAQAIVEQPKLVFQLSSGDLNPMRMDRRDDADRPLQAAAVSRQGDRQQVPERAGRPDGVPSGDRGALRSVLAAHLQSGGQADLEDAGAHSTQLGRGPLLRVRRPHEEGLRRDPARHDRSRREHHAVPTVHLRERLRLPGRQHPRAAGPPDARGPAEADLGAGEAGPLRLLDEHPLPGPGALGAARAGRDLRGSRRRRSTATTTCSSSFDATTKLHAHARPRCASKRRQARGDLQLRATCNELASRIGVFLARAEGPPPSGSCCARRTRPSGRWPTSASSRRTPPPFPSTTR